MRFVEENWSFERLDFGVLKSLYKSIDKTFLFSFGQMDDFKHRVYADEKECCLMKISNVIQYRRFSWSKSGCLN